MEGIRNVFALVNGFFDTLPQEVVFVGVFALLGTLLVAILVGFK